MGHSRSGKHSTDPNKTSFRRPAYFIGGVPVPLFCILRECVPQSVYMIVSLLFFIVHVPEQYVKFLPIFEHYSSVNGFFQHILF